MRASSLSLVLLALSLWACGEAAPPAQQARSPESTEASASPAAEPATTAAEDSAAVVAAVDAFHAALASADTAAIDQLLADRAVVLESGGIETRAEYFDHHLGADMAFAAAVPGNREVVRVEVSGDVAWLAATSQRSGTFRDREIDSRGAELVVLARQADGWRVTAIHWSSR